MRVAKPAIILKGSRYFRPLPSGLVQFGRWGRTGHGGWEFTWGGQAPDMDRAERYLDEEELRLAKGADRLRKERRK